MRQHRAKKIGNRVRIIADNLEGYQGMRPFQAKRFGQITGHKITDKKISGYIITTDLGDEFTLARTQFATSALTKSAKYPAKKS